MSFERRGFMIPVLLLAVSNQNYELRCMLTYLSREALLADVLMLATREESAQHSQRMYAERERGKKARRE